MHAVSFRALRFAFSLATLLALWASGARAQTPLELKKGDHISIIGNTLADRMQHHGGLETLLHARFPEHQLVVRNLGFSGDEINGGLRLRSANFGSLDEHLKIHQTDVIFAFFGYGEAQAGEAGLEKFKGELAGFIKHTLSQKYNGESAPRLVLFSPIAHEDLKDRNLPDGKENNARLKLYTTAMSEVAKANGALFVDLFTPSLLAYNEAARPLTINGIHLSELGDKAMAPRIDQALFGGPAAKKLTDAQLEKLRQAVNQKNFLWFNRYRTTDGFSIFGGRADLKFVEGQTNRVVMQREMEILDALTANHDQRVWSVAAGGDAPASDITPDFIPVVTNKPGPLPGGKHVFLGGVEAIEKMKVGPGMKVTLFASEEDFPELVNPVQMAFDGKGRLWVATWPTYPHWKPKQPMNDRLLILEDTNGDGKADKSTTFASDLHNPTGFEFWGGGVLVAMTPDLLFLKDTDGDDKYDVKERVISGLDSADTHHAANSFTLDPGGALYFQEGTFHHSQVETPWGPTRRVANGAVFRYEPRAQKFDVYVTHGFANPHGHAFDRWGQDIVVDGTGSVPFHAALFSGHIEFPNKHGGTPTVYQQRTRPCPGIEYLSSSHFPPERQGNLLVGNVIGFQGILEYKMHDEGSSFGAKEVEPIVSSSDPNFRPADMEVAPDGSLYFTDWQNPIIGHMQHNLRDPSRDVLHGRVYRVTCEGRPLVPAVKIAGESIDKLLDVLKHADNRIRYRAKIELSGRDTKQVVAALEKWIAGLDKASPDYEHQMMEALWVYQHHNEVNTAHLERMLKSPVPEARAAATRVLCYWRDRVSNSLELAKQSAGDEHPRVRLEAIRTASFFNVPEAVEVVVISGEKTSDKYLDYLSKETMRTLDPYWKKALADGRDPAFTSDAGARYLLKTTSTENLLKRPRGRAVFLEMLNRPGMRDEHRREAIRGLAALDKKAELAIIMDAIAGIDSKQAVDTTVVFDLVRQLTGRSTAELQTARAELEKLATTAKQPILRQIGFVSLVNVDGSFDKAWALASQTPSGLRDFVNAMPLISDAGVRATLYPKIEALLTGLPGALAGQGGSGNGTLGRYVRIELPKNGTLTLAEVEVMSEGRNIARRGKATQKNTAHGGDASRAIDGNTKSEFGGGGQTHTEENTGKPWWELDLGDEAAIEGITIYNREDGDLGKRLDGFTLLVLDKSRGEVYRKEKIPYPNPKASFEQSAGSPAVVIRRAAMDALTHVRGQETKTFESLARFVRENNDRSTAIRAIQRIPRNAWPKDQAPGLVSVLLADIKKLPPAERTSPAALDMLEMTDALAALLPVEECRKLRAELGEIGVRVIRVGTLFERMSFDKDVIVVRAGKPVEFLFDNSDLMPHNLVITQPGALEEIGMAAEASAQAPDAAARHYVPKSGKVLLASPLLQPRESTKLSFTAPTKPGVYPIVCTYPGHWRRMYAALYVVEDLNAYEENADAYLAAHPLEIKDALLKDRRPRTEWKFDELASAVAGIEGRSFANGKHLFTVANCIACHKQDGVGNVIGPDLVKLDLKYKPLDILKDLLEPSSRIEEKFQTFTFELESGKAITGMVLEETPDQVKVVENPLAKAEPLVIKKTDIASRAKSPISIMPKGLLDKLNREEILDLIAYIAARGNKEHAVFQGGHEGHKH